MVETFAGITETLGLSQPPVRIALVTDAWYPQVNGVVTTLNQVKTNLEADAHEMLVVNPSLFRTVPCPKYSEIRLAWWPRGQVRRLLDEFQPEAVHIATEGPLGMLARSTAASGAGRSRPRITRSFLII